MTRPFRTTLAAEQLGDRLAPSAGGLDPTFGTDGRVAQAIDSPDQPALVAMAVAVQPDGRIILAGYPFGAARLDPDGSPDPTFGSGGVATPVLPPHVYGAQLTVAAVAVRPDGKLVLAGSPQSYYRERSDFVVLRLNPDGSPDATFGTGGWAVVSFPPVGQPGADPLAVARDVAVQPDGRVVVAGSAAVPGSPGYDWAAARLNPDGTPDLSFGDGGRVTLGFAGAEGFPYHDASAVFVGSDGRIVLTGRAGQDFAAARLTPAGDPDPTFGTDGRAVVPDPPGPARHDYPSAGTRQPDGRILVAGRSFLDRDEDAAVVVVRLDPDGCPDPSFGAGGRVSLPITAPDALSYPADVVLDPAGRIVLAGGPLAAVRLHPDGTPDPTYTSARPGGIPDEWSGWQAAAALPDGRVVVAGNVATHPPMEGFFFGGYLVARLRGDPPPARPVLVGGPPDGTTRLLSPVMSGYGVGPTIAIFPGFAGAVRTASADVTGDGVPDLVGGAGPGGGPAVVVIDGATGARVAEFFAFEPDFVGGVFVAAADLDADGRAEVVVAPDRGGGPVVAVYSGARLAAGTASVLGRFLGIRDPDFRGGARPALGDVNGDGAPDLVVGAGYSGGPRVALFDGRDLAAGAAEPRKLIGDFFAFESTLRNGVFLAAGDATGDGAADLAFGGGPGGAPRVRLFDGSALLAAGAFGDPDALAGSARRADFFAGDPALRGGVRLSLRDADGDGTADLVAGSGEGEPGRVRVYRAASLLTDTGPTPDQELDPFDASLPDGVFVG